MNNIELLFKIGVQYRIKTEMYMFIGKIYATSSSEIELKDAVSIAPFVENGVSLLTGNFEVIEDFPENIIINRDKIIVAVNTNHISPAI